MLIIIAVSTCESQNALQYERGFNSIHEEGEICERADVTFGGNTGQNSLSPSLRKREAFTNKAVVWLVETMIWIEEERDCYGLRPRNEGGNVQPGG